MTKTTKTVYAEITNTFSINSINYTYEIGRRWKILKSEIQKNGLDISMGHGIKTIIPWSHCKLIEVTKVTTETLSERTISI